MLPHDLQRLMLAKSTEIDQAVAEQKERGLAWVNADKDKRVAMNTALATAEGANAQERKAKAELTCEPLIYAEQMASVLKDSALEALRAKRDQLGALNALSYTIRTEMQMAR
jgi:hypothetical protein